MPWTPPPSAARPRRDRGLSRFEFAVCVAVLGILLAVALPYVDSPRVAARRVRLETLLAATQASAALFHGRCEIQHPAPCDRMEFSGQWVEGVHGWPAATPAGIAAALKLHGPTADIQWQPVQIDGVPALRARLAPTGMAGTCEFIYAQAESPGAVPRIELIDASCP